MASDNVIETALQCQHLEWPAETQCHWPVIGGIRRFNLGKKPGAFLGKSHRKIPLSPQRHERRWSRLSLRRLLLGHYVLRQASNGGGCKEDVEGNFHVQFLSEASQKLRGQQRITPALEEIVMDTHLCDTYHLRPERCQLLFQRRPWRRPGDGRGPGDCLGFCQAQDVGKPYTLEFTRGSLREFLYKDDLPWDFKFRQVRSSKGAQGMGRYRRAMTHDHGDCDLLPKLAGEAAQRRPSLRLPDA